MTRRKKILAGAGIVVAAALGLGAWWYVSGTETKEVRGSPTVEFDPGEAPRAIARPKKVVLEVPWPFYGYDRFRSHQAPFRIRPPFRLLWTMRSGYLIEFPPVVGYGRVYLAQDHGRFFAVNAKSGSVLWQKRFAHCSAASPAMGERVVYMSYMQPLPCPREPRTAPGFVAALDASTGKELWRFKTGVVESSPLLVNGTLYFGSWDHYLYALDVRGKRPRVRWRFLADDELNSSAAYAEGTVYIGSDGGHLYAVDAHTGKLRWRASSFSRFLRGREYFYATPTIAYGRVYIGNTDGTLYAFGAASGHLLWARKAGTYVYSAAAVWRQRIYVGTYDGYLSAFDAATGDLIWKVPVPGAIHGAPTVLDGLVYFSTCGGCGRHGSRYAKRGSGGTYAADARTGKLVWSFFDGRYSPVVADAERLYLVGKSRLYGLAPSARTTGASSQGR